MVGGGFVADGLWLVGILSSYVVIMFAQYMGETSCELPPNDVQPQTDEGTNLVRSPKKVLTSQELVCPLGVTTFLGPRNPIF